MKIFLPVYSFEDSFTDNVAETLKAMGHEVRVLGHVSPTPSWPFLRNGARLVAARICGERPSGEDRQILKIARLIRPDVIFSPTKPIHPEVLDALGKLCPGRRILWWGDPPANSTRWGILDPGWDAVYLKDARAVEKLRLIGRNAYLMHEAMNPMWHKPIAEVCRPDIAVVGSSYAYRQSICLRLIESGHPVTVYGPRPPVWSMPQYLKLHTGRYLVREEKSRIFGEALGCLNTFPLSEGDSLNCRTFEIAGAGGLQLVEARPSISECFEPGKELLVFSTFEELSHHIERARVDQGAMRMIRTAGARRALAEHTYRHRLEIILQRM